jgi:mRNA interferase RelE/StbE
MKTIVFAPAAAKQLDALPRRAAEAVLDALALHALAGRGDVRALKGREGYRLQVGDYRVVFAEDAVTILAVYVGRRTTTTYR